MKMEQRLITLIQGHMNGNNNNKKKMIMKIQNILLCILTLSCLCSCSDDFGKRTAPETGTPIRFSAYIATENESRTSYGDLNGDNKWPIYWSNGDTVSIYCPEAFVEDGTSSDDVADTKTGKYTINVTSATETKYSLSGLNSLCWGASDEHNFFTVYPSSVLYHRNADGNDDGTFVLSVPREQSATLQKTETVDGTTVWRYADMNASVMAGHEAVKKSQVDENTVIDLPFNPITTAFDIEILPPADGEYESYTITSVQIANSEGVTDGRTALAGGFKYNAKTKTYGEYSYSGEDVSAVTVNVQLPTGGVKLTRGNDEKLVVTAFLLPDNLPSTLRVIVNCKKTPSEGSVLTGETGIVYKNIDLSSSSNICGKKNTIKLGNLPNHITFSYETWMANLPDNTYVSQISMPGTHDAGAYNTGNTLQSWAQTQTLDIPGQFDKGVRVFDFRPACSYSDGTYSFDIAHGLVTLNTTFDGVLASAVSWLSEHPTEFIIIQLKNESSSYSDLDDSFWGVDLQENFTLWQKQIRARLLNVNSEYVIADFNPSMTLKEARGKLIFMSRDDYYPSADDTSAYGGWYGCKVSGWPDNNASWYRTFYTTSNPNGIGTLWVSDLYGSGTLSAPEQSEKNSAILAMLTKAKDNTCTPDNKSQDTWYMTWLNVRGTISTPGRQTGVYNAYAAEIISGSSATEGSNGFTGFSQNGSYENAGIVMIDWAGYADYNGDDVIQAVIDNNFRGGGPAQKTN